MHIVYINHYAGSIYHGMEYRPYYLACEWVKLGYQVTIVASDYSHLRSKNVVIPKHQKYYTEVIDGINYIWCKTPPYPKNGIKRLINIFSFLFAVNRLIPQLVTTNPTHIIASSTYPFDTVLAKKLARATKAKFIYEVHDLWPLTPIELGGMSKYHPLIWLMQCAENYGYKKADWVVSLLPCAKEYMLSHGMHPAKFRYVPNGVRCREWLSGGEEIPERHLQIIQMARNSCKLLIGYAGSMGESNALEYLIAVAKRETQVGFILVGDGVSKGKLLELVADSNLKNVYILDAIKKSQVANFLSQMDLLYIGWHKLPIYRFGISPNKIFDYMLAKKPILHSVTAGNDIVSEAKCGISVEAQNIDAIQNAIIRFMGMSDAKREELGNNGYTYVTNNHDYKTLAQNFIKE